MKILELLERIAVALEAMVTSRTAINELHSFVVTEMAEQWLATVAYADAGNNTDIREHFNEYHATVITSEETDTPPQPWHFDPKSGEFPDIVYDTKVGYVIMTKDAPLQVVGKENVLTEYENPSWASNNDGREITAKKGRILMVYSPPGNEERELHTRDGKPFSFKFDGAGVHAWQVMYEQFVDGHDLKGFTHPLLFVKASDAEIWEPK